MAAQLRLAIAQLNFTVGDISNNLFKIKQACEQALAKECDLVVFPELALTGYPPEDLLLRPDLQQQIDTAIHSLRDENYPLTLVLGTPERWRGHCYNAAIVIQHGKITNKYHKQHLPNYGVFDEKRYFTAGHQPCIFDVNSVLLGVVICEDLWREKPCEQAVEAGAQAILCLNASPYDNEKSLERESILRQQIAHCHVPIVYAHCVGGQDELVFDGGSLVMDHEGEIIHQAPYFEETLFCFNWLFPPVKQSVNLPSPLKEEAHIYSALVLGVRDYVQKNGFKGALLGLSGGIDSALSLAIAVDALGAENVSAYMLPSQFTAAMSREDAKQMANILGVAYHEISIEPTIAALTQSLAPHFKEYAPDLTEENLQARARGVLLMALSNKTGRLLLSTGNKSEMAVGYATLYGDMAGGFAVLKDVYKTLVYRLANYRNEQQQVIPERIITRPPSAELAHNQLDEDSLPPYPILDAILARYVEQDQSRQAIIDAGFEASDVEHVLRLVNKNEYKRRQAAPGVRITRKAFGRERRFPITSGFKPDLSADVT